MLEVLFIPLNKLMELHSAASVTPLGLLFPTRQPCFPFPLPRSTLPCLGRPAVYFACQVTLQLKRSNCHGDTTCCFIPALLSAEGHSYFSGELNPKGSLRIFYLNLSLKGDGDGGGEAILICAGLFQGRKKERS